MQAQNERGRVAHGNALPVGKRHHELLLQLLVQVTATLLHDHRHALVNDGRQVKFALLDPNDNVLDSLNQVIHVLVADDLRAVVAAHNAVSVSKLADGGGQRLRVYHFNLVVEVGVDRKSVV